MEIKSCTYRITESEVKNFLSNTAFITVKNTSKYYFESTADGRYFDGKIEYSDNDDKVSLFLSMMKAEIKERNNIKKEITCRINVINCMILEFSKLCNLTAPGEAKSINILSYKNGVYTINVNY